MAHTTPPAAGRTVLAHVMEALDRAEQAVRETRDVVNCGRRPGPKEREAMRRELAGAIASLETVRLWLDAGAPRGRDRDV